MDDYKDFYKNQITDIINHLKKEELETRKSKNGDLLKLQELSNIGHWDLDIPTKKITWSENIYKILNLDPKTFIPEMDSIFKLTHPDDREKVETILKNHPSTGAYNNRIILGDKTVLYIETTFQVVYDKTREPGRVIGTIQDVSKYKKLENDSLEHIRFLQKLDQIDRTIINNNNLDQMMNNVLDLILIIFNCERAWFVYSCDPYAPNWRVIMERTQPEYPGALDSGEIFPMTKGVVDSFNKLLSSENPGAKNLLPGETDWDPEDRFSIRSSMTMAIYPKSTKPWVFGIHQCSGTRNWTNQEKELFKEIGHRVTDAISTLIYSRDLQESREQYKRIFDNVAVSIVTVNETGEITDINPYHISNIGKGLTQKKDYIGYDISRYPSIVSAGLGELYKSVLQGETIDKKAVYFPQTSGDMAGYFNIRGVPLIKNNTVTGAVFVHENITEIKKAEEEKKILRELLQQNQKMQAIGTLAGGIAHDFNNILSGIVGYADMSLDNVTKDSILEKYIKQILKATDRATNLIDQILSFSRQSTEKKIPLYIGPIVKEAIQLLRASLPTTIKIKSNIADDTKAVMGDSTKIHEIIINLGINASYAMEEKGILEITYLEEKVKKVIKGCVSTIPPGFYSVLKVKDNGCGMEEEIISHIFEPFYTTRKTGEGTGMGLSVLLGIIQDHNGHITIDSELENGSIFQIFLPKTEENINTIRNKTTMIQGNSEKIMFIDDEEMICSMLKKMLTQIGYNVTIYTDSRKALEAFAKTPNSYDLIITDQTMPDISGFELSQKAMKIKSDIPVILCTGFSNVVDKEKAEKSGIKGFVSKPYRRNEIASAIDNALYESGK